MEKFSSKFLIVLSISAAVLFAAGAYVFAAYDIEKAKLLEYPIEELGNCQNFDECKVYCNKDENIPKCNRFSIKNSLLTKEEVRDTEKLISLMEESGLPGKCRGMVECFSYCESAAHLDECWDYTQRHNLNQGYDLETIRRLAKYAREGGKFPGDCQGHVECNAYCEDPSHMRECLDFAEKVEIIPPDELAEAKQVLRALESGARLPGGCRDKEACEAYCEDFSHMEECFEFAVAAGFIPPEEVEQARKAMPFMLKGEMPGGCRSKEQCETYCSQEEHMEECITFFEKAGLISQEDLEMFRKTGGKGPGGCKEREECESFCNDPANQAVCFEFAKEHGLVPEEELEHMKEGMQRFQEGFQQAPPEVAQCLKEQIGEEILAKIEAGTFMPNPELGEHMRGCFEDFVPSFEGAPEGFEGLPPEGFEGPRGEGLLQGKTPEQIACIERVLGGALRPPTPEEEQRIAGECFGAPSGGFEGFQPQGEFPIPPGGFEGGITPEGGESLIQNLQEQIASCIEQRLRSLGGIPTAEQEQRIREECYGAAGQIMPVPSSGGVSVLEVGIERRTSILGVFSPFVALLLFAL